MLYFMKQDIEYTLNWHNGKLKGHFTLITENPPK